MGNGPDAVIFDLDGVITFTARVHAAAWKELFDDYLRARGRAYRRAPFRPFDAAADYYAYVDGKPRYDGVQSFLKSRAIDIPYGSPSDSPGDETVCGLGNRKDDLFKRKIDETGVGMDAEAVRFAHELRNRGVRVGLASSSRNAVPILQKAGILNLLQAIVDGLVSERLHLHGKPEPDIFLECLAELDRVAKSTTRSCGRGCRLRCRGRPDRRLRTRARGRPQPHPCTGATRGQLGY